jgi:hypothetical protein
VKPADALLAALRGGRAWVPSDASAELVAQLEAQGCEVVRSVWVEVVTWQDASGETSGRVAVLRD